MLQKILFLILFPFLINAQVLTKEEALADIQEFESLLQTQSSYFQLEGVSDDFEKSIEKLRSSILQKSAVEAPQLWTALEKIMASIPDRHASVKLESFNKKDFEISSICFPVMITGFENSLVALKETSKRKYEYHFLDYPIIHAIDGIPIATYIDSLAYRRMKAPIKSKLNRASQDLRDYGELLLKQGILKKEKVNITFTNKSGATKTETFKLSDDKQKWRDYGTQKARKIENQLFRENLRDYSELYELRSNNIAVFTIPSMISEEEFPGMTKFFENKIQQCLDAKGVIIDIRGNGGGSREILNIFAPYLISPTQSPWVANVAYVRSDQHLDEDISSMSHRSLYNYDSQKLDSIDRKAIDHFNTTFKPKVNFDRTKFSAPYYMVLKNGAKQFAGPVYILTNERCFSAASVFITAFKGLGNVNIIGTTSDGSSGRSRVFRLKHSNIRVKLSTMISLQQSGYPLDGYGTTPDIQVERNEAQLFGNEDFQMNKTIQLISN